MSSKYFIFLAVSPVPSKKKLLMKKDWEFREIKRIRDDNIIIFRRQKQT